MIFTKQNMFLSVPASDKRMVLKFLASQAETLGVVKKKEQLLQDYLAREQESTTGFGNGIAIPHAKSQNVKTPIILFARLNKAIEWQSLDGEPVDTVISILVPTSDSNIHLKLLASLSRRLVHQEFIQVLKNGSQDQVYQEISQIVNV